MLTNRGGAGPSQAVVRVQSARPFSFVTKNDPTASNHGFWTNSPFTTSTKPGPRSKQTLVLAPADPGAVSIGGLASAGAFGAVVVNQTVSIGGLSSAGAFGTVAANQVVLPAGLGSAGAFGTVTPQNTQAISITGLGSSGAFGTIRANQAVTIGGLASTGAFGALKANQAVTVGGLSSAGVFGSATAAITNQYVHPGGLGSAQVFGAAGASTPGGVPPALSSLTIYVRPPRKRPRVL